MKPINETPISSDAAYERETVINFCDAEKKASYYTRNRSRMQELRNLAAEYPDDVAKLVVQQVRDRDIGRSELTSYLDHYAIFAESVLDAVL